MPAVVVASLREEAAEDDAEYHAREPDHRLHEGRNVPAMTWAA